MVDLLLVNKHNANAVQILNSAGIGKNKTKNGNVVLQSNNQHLIYFYSEVEQRKYMKYI